MVKFLCLLLLFALFFTASALVDDLHQSPISINSNQTETNCQYTVLIKTSCSSIPYTTDELSLAFGDADGNEVNAARIDDPNTRTFERCSRYVFELRGPCMDIICYVALMRNGSDGWKPKSVMIYGPHLKPIIWIVDIFLLNGMWYEVAACVHTSILYLSIYYPVYCRLCFSFFFFFR